MGYSYDKFKSYTIREDTAYKNPGMWEIVLNDLEDADYVFTSVLDKIDDFLEANQLLPIRNLIWTIYEDYDFWESNSSKDEAEQKASHLVSPDKCLSYIKDNHIIELLEQQKPEDCEDMMQQLRVLIEYWEQGYYVCSSY